MKNFRFRGRLESMNVWITGNGMEFIPGRGKTDDVAYILNRGFKTQVEPKTVSQFTGACDSEGVEVYEGDIVQYEFFDDDCENMSAELHVVEFHDGKFECRYISKRCNVPYVDIDILDESRVIGNRWETPELLLDAVCADDAIIDEISFDDVVKDSVPF